MDHENLKSTLVFAEDTVIDEEALEFNRNLAKTIIDTSIQLEARRKEILMQAHKSLSVLEAVSITDEMIELGLDHQVRQMIQEAELYYSMHKHLMDEDDTFSDQPWDCLS